MASTVTLALMSLTICCTARLMTARPSVGSSRRAATACRKSKSSCSSLTATQAVFLGMLLALRLALLDDGEQCLGFDHCFKAAAHESVDIVCREQRRRRLQQRVPAPLGGIGQRGGRGRRRLIEALAQARAHTAVGSAASRIMGERFVPALANRQAHAASVLASRESFSSDSAAARRIHSARDCPATFAAFWMRRY